LSNHILEKITVKWRNQSLFRNFGTLKFSKVEESRKWCPWWWKTCWTTQRKRSALT